MSYKKSQQKADCFRCGKPVTMLRILPGEKDIPVCRQHGVGVSNGELLAQWKVSQRPVCPQARM